MDRSDIYRKFALGYPPANEEGYKKYLLENYPEDYKKQYGDKQ